MQQQNNPWIEQFLDALWLERNLAENTLSAYRLDLQQLADWLVRQQSSLLTAGAPDLQSYLADRLTKGYKAASSARLLSAMRRFLPVSVPGKSA